MSNDSIKVFINYRHNDTKAVASKISKALNNRFGEGICYFDIADHCSYGTPLSEAIKKHVKSAEVFLALIGPHWLFEKDEMGESRLHDPDDFVRQEIEFAKILTSKKKMTIIPIHVGEVDLNHLQKWLDRYVPSLGFLHKLKGYSIDPKKPALEKLLEKISKLIPIPVRTNSEESVSVSNANIYKTALDRQFPLKSCYQTTNADSPFVGLHYFREQDAPLFFGRTQETLKLCETVRGYNLTLLYGQSGVGKSSLLHAGLLARLGEEVPSVYIRRDKCLGYDDQFSSLLAEHERQATVVILDQVEEIYTDRREDARHEEREFWNILERSLFSYPLLNFVLSFRYEHYANVKEALRHRNIRLIDEQELFLEPLKREGIFDAIYGVARDPNLANRFRLEIDDSLADLLSTDLLDNVNQESHIGVLLQYHLRKLWTDAQSRRSNESDLIRLTGDQYRSLRRTTLDGMLDDQLALLAPNWRPFLINGLVLDVLYRYTTELNTAALVTDQDIIENYSHIEEFQSFFADLKNKLLLLIPSGTRNVPVAHLAHDSLAAVIRRRFQKSNAPGQCASRLVAAKIGLETGTLSFSESDLATIRSGWFGMGMLQAEILNKIEDDEATYQSQKQHRLNTAIQNAEERMEQLEFEDSLKFLQSANSESIADERIWKVAGQLPYPLDQLCQRLVQKKAQDFMAGHEMFLADDKSMASRFYPEMVEVTGGKFKMGCKEGYADEGPIHDVHLSTFLVSATPVTWWQYCLFCRLTNQKFPRDGGFGRGERPAIHISWYDAVEYCNWLTKRVGKVKGRGLDQVYTTSGKNVSADWSRNGYRLPTEAEWEYAAREMGREVRFGNGKDVADSEQMNFDSEHELNKWKPQWFRYGESKGFTTEVRLYPPNALGLYDMSGNVYEWCWDWWSAGKKHFYNTSGGSKDPIGPECPEPDERRVTRGGSWLNVANLCRCSSRWRLNPAYKFNNLGFRVVRRP